MAKSTQTIEGEDVQDLSDILEDDEDTETEAKASTVTPTEIAEATGADPKAVRAFLRANFARSKDMKGKSWALDADTAAKVIEHFEQSEDDEDEAGDESDS